MFATRTHASYHGQFGYQTYLKGIDYQVQSHEMTDSDTGGGKKFLYSGNAKGKGGHLEENGADPWSFPAKPATESPKGLKLDLDDVWSIRNVGLGPSARSVLSECSTVKSEVLTKNASTAFYSRHGGMKGRSSPGANGLSTGPAGGSNWSSSGHGLGQPGQPSGQQGGLRSGAPVPAAFQSPTEKAFRSGGRSRNRRFQNPSPFDHDLNDF